jgi:hypothetical protein
MPGGVSGEKFGGGQLEMGFQANHIIGGQKLVEIPAAFIKTWHPAVTREAKRVQCIQWFDIFRFHGGLPCPDPGGFIVEDFSVLMKKNIFTNFSIVLRILP